MEHLERIQRYNERYKFLNGQTSYGFDFNPERLIIRNFALRTGDRGIYEEYLTTRFPSEASFELEQFDLIKTNLLRLNTYEAERFLKDQRINLLRSDIWYQEDDSIFTALRVGEEDILLLTEGMDTEIIENHVFPEVVLNRQFVWLDTTQLAEFSQSSP
ncbi:hypothetical protein [Sphingobacterium suaedae]|uniref:Uncharacterized protein n=1 Tax=Sphingobacterium suaedae TaxID=1686402 RepID=A0ABW5KN23_9SPHI